MESISANAVGKVRKAILNGRDYLVAPLSLIVPGVLSGSEGSLYYPEEEIASTAAAWNHAPLVVYHPTYQGKNVSVRHPGILNQQGVGELRRVEIRNGKLTAEGWFDVEATRRVDARVLSSLERGTPIELSTGLFTDNEIAPIGSHHKGRPYDYIARNYRPDHLAILPDQKGACSILDGCGVLINKNQDQLLSQLIANKQADGSLTPQGWAKMGELLGVTNFGGPPPTPPGLTPKQLLAGVPDEEDEDGSKSDDDDENKKGSKGEDDGDDGGKENTTTNANPEGHNQYTNRGAVALTKKAHQSSQATEQVEDHTRQNTDAVDAVRVSGVARSSSDQKRMASAKRYHTEAAALHDKAAAREHDMGYHEAGAAHEKAASAHKAAAMYREGLSANATGMTAQSPTPQSPAPQAPTQPASGKPKKSAKPHKATLSGSSEALERQQEYESMVGTPASNAGINQPRHSESGQYLHHGAGTGKGDVHTAAGQGFKDIENYEELDRSPESVLKTEGTMADMTDNCGGKGGTKGPCKGSGISAAANKSSHDANSQTAQITGTKGSIKQAKNAHVAARDANQKASDFHADMAGKFKKAGNESAATAHSTMAQAHGLYAKAHGGAAEDHGKALSEMKAESQAKGKPALRGGTNNRWLAMNREQKIDLIVNRCSCESDRAALNSLSDAALAAFNARSQDYDEDEDDSEDSSMTSSEMEDRDNGRDDMRRNAGGADTHSFDDGPVKAGSTQVGGKGTKDEYNTNEQKWFASAPPRIQSAVRNAMEIEHRERQSLVSRLVANVSDQKTRNRLTTNYMQKPLDELRDILALLPPQQALNAYQSGDMFLSTANYLGAGGGPLTNRANTIDPNEDLLPLPTLNYAELAREQRQQKA